MVFPKKKQSRLWAVSVVYKTLIRNDSFRQIHDEIEDIEEIESFFSDDIIFSYKKGDVEYFKQIYNNVANNIKEIEDIIENFIRLKNLNPFLKACVVCALCEIKYMNLENKTAISKYKEIVSNHSFDGSENIINLLDLDKNRD